MRRLAAARSWLTALLVVGSPGCGDSDAIDGYFAARDDRIVQFCHCYSASLGYDYGDAPGHVGRSRCVSREQLGEPERACIESIFQERDPAPYDVVFECWADAEAGYAWCLEQLSCSDSRALAQCREQYQDLLDDCPRLSVADQRTVDRCTGI